MTPAEFENAMDAYVDRWYSASYETSGFYVLSRSNMDDLIEHAFAMLGEQ